MISPPDFVETRSMDSLIEWACTTVVKMDMSDEPSETEEDEIIKFFNEAAGLPTIDEETQDQESEKKYIEPKTKEVADDTIERETALYITQDLNSNQVISINNNETDINHPDDIESFSSDSNDSFPIIKLPDIDETDQIEPNISVKTISFPNKMYANKLQSKLFPSTPSVPCKRIYCCPNKSFPSKKYSSFESENEDSSGRFVDLNLEETSDSLQDDTEKAAECYPCELVETEAYPNESVHADVYPNGTLQNERNESIDPECYRKLQSYPNQSDQIPDSCQIDIADDLETESFSVNQSDEPVLMECPEDNTGVQYRNALEIESFCSETIQIESSDSFQAEPSMESLHDLNMKGLSLNEKPKIDLISFNNNSNSFKSILVDITEEKPHMKYLVNKSLDPQNGPFSNKFPKEEKKDFSCKPFPKDMFAKDPYPTEPFKERLCHCFLRSTERTKTKKSPIGEKTYECKICGQIFKEIATMEAHLTIHDRECASCDHFLDNSFTHGKKHNGVKTKYKCKFCAKEFIKTENLLHHLRTHTGEKPYRCMVCEKIFNQSSSYTRHMRTHTGEKPFECVKCGKRYTESSKLKTHMRKHTGEKPYQCTICKQILSHLSTFKRHMLAHEVQPYTCDLCKKCFPNSIRLAQHKKTHFKQPRIRAVKESRPKKVATKTTLPFAMQPIVITVPAI